ncbi:MAG: hypothetical protein AB8B59_04235 [Maribacter sp.]
MKKEFLLVLAFFLTVILCAQTASMNQQTNEQFKIIPQESAYVHYNTSLLFSGEKLQYKLYFIDLKTKKLSKISKVGYISLVGKNGVKVFDQKIILKNGTGYGDFFVPSSVPTGSYKLLAYSQWMKNQGIDSFFQSNIQIINPYLPLPTDHIEVSKDSMLISENQTLAISSKNLKKDITNNYIDIYLDKTNYNKRQKLSLKLRAHSTNVEKGTYSISIRKLDEISVPNDISINTFYKKTSKTQNQNFYNDTIRWIPELRGQLISGKIIDDESKNPIHGEKVVLSLPGRNYLFHVATTNKKGDFYFNLDERYDNLKGNLQLVSANNQNVDIIVNKHSLNVSGLEFFDFKVPDQLEKNIKERSFHNQIENAYLEEKSDSLIPTELKAPFYRNLETSYQLDDYTRFNTISETIVEIIDNVSLRTLKNGKRVFQVRPSREEYSGDPGIPLVFIDGLFVQDHEDILEYNAKNLSSISFSRSKYLVGTEVFQGIVHFETVKQDFVESFYSPGIKSITLFRPQPEKIYYNQSYETSGKVSNRIPDFRYQLLWAPQLNLINTEEIHFYSSDVTGDYEIVLEGFTEGGQPVSMRKFFTVK